MLWPLPLSFCTPINAPHGVITPLEDVFWNSHWECLKLSVWDVLRNSRGAASAVPGPGIWKCQSFCVFSEEGRGCGESFLALSAGPQQMANWTSTMRPSGAILMLHMLHPAAMTSWRLLSHSPSQPSPWLHNPNCGEQTLQTLTNTNRHQYENPFQARNHHMHSKTFQTHYQAVFYQPSTFW